jgi:predicted RNase H-like nuclease (RuvC/YqgF family)
MPVDLTPEARTLLELYDARVRQTMLEISKEIGAQVGELRKEFSEQLLGFRAEIMQQIEAIRRKQETQSETIEALRREVVQIRTRLDEGDKRFESQERMWLELKKELQARIATLENDLMRQGRGIAALGGAALAGGAVGGALTKWFFGM